MKKTIALLLALGAAAGALAGELALDYRRPQVLLRPAGSLAHTKAAPGENVVREEFLSAAETPRLRRDLAVGDALTLRLFDDAEARVVLADELPSSSGRMFLGRADAAESPRCAVLMQSRNGLQVHLQDVGGGRTFSISETDQGAYVREFAPGRGKCEELAPEDDDGEAAAAEPPRPEQERLADDSTPCRVDILVVFDAPAAAWAAENGYSPRDFAEMQVGRMNAALRNTSLTDSFSFRLKGVKCLGCSLGTRTSAAVQNVRYGRTVDGVNLSVVGEWRDALGADIVCIVIDTGSAYGTTGTGFSLENVDDPSSFARSAYNATAVRSDAGTHTMTHEVGHNMGAGHTDMLADLDSCGPQSYPYSCGYYFTGGDGVGYRTIMAYDSDGFGNSYEEAPYFSSPRHFFNGVAVGDATHDNTTAIRNLCSAVSGFRSENQATAYDDAPPAFATVVFDANGGRGGKTVTATVGKPVGALPEPKRDGYIFVGWYTARNGGARVSASTVVRRDATFYAHWAEPEPEERAPFLCEKPSGTVPNNAASEYIGYLADQDGGVRGTIQVKIGKPNPRSGTATVKATVIADGAKATLKAPGGRARIAATGPTTLVLDGAHQCLLTLGMDGMTGRCGAFTVDGAQNFFASKDRGVQSAAAAALAGRPSAMNIIWNGGSASATLAAKGKARVSGTTAAGAKFSSTQCRFIFGQKWCCIPFAAARSGVAFCIWMPADGKGAATVTGLGDGARAGSPGALPANASFSIDKAKAEELWSGQKGRLLADYLPCGVPISRNGTRWVLPKAGKVVYLRGTATVDPAKTLDNPSGLKLSYSAKSGSFKGSFKAYADNGGARPKAVTVNVNGVMIEGTGHATCSIRKGGAAPATVR